MKKALSIWMGSILLVLVTVAAVGGLASVKYFQIRAQMEAPPPPEQPITVRAAAATSVEFQQHVTAIGTVLAPRSIVLSNEIAGTVAAVYLQAGEIAEPGELLVELDTRVLEAQLESAKALAQRTESTRKRLQEASRVVARDELEEAIAAEQQAGAQVKELEAMIDKKYLRAPFRARVGLSDTHEGQFLPSGSEIVSLQGVEGFIYVDFMVPQSAAGFVNVGQSVTLQAHGQTYQGDIEALDAEADRSSRSRMARVKVDLDDDPSQEQLIPGDSVEVMVAYGPEQSAVSVPVESLLSMPMETMVFVIEQDSAGATRANKRVVVPGPTVNDQVYILSGLRAGERVVSDGAFRLREGALLNIPPPTENGTTESPVDSLTLRSGASLPLEVSIATN